MARTEKIRIEVVYATAERQDLVTVEVPVGTTITGAMELCRRLALLPEAAFANPDLGVFGRRESADRVLEPGDRVEIYRPLEVDPKEARRRRALYKRKRSTG